MDENSDTIDDEVAIEEEFLKRAKFRRHSSAVVSGLNGFHKRPVQLYLVRINPGCRIIWLYMLQNNIPHILHDVDFSKGEKHVPEAIRKHPHREVPILVDGDYVIFEAPAILTYLASNYTEYAGYGIALQSRMLCESLLSWANSELHRAIGYNFIYPQFLEKYMLSSESANEQLVESGLKTLSRQLEILETRYLNDSHFLTGNRLTVADSFVGTVIVQMEWAGMTLKMWPRVESWLSRVKRQVHWDTVHLAHNVFLREMGRASLLD